MRSLFITMSIVALSFVCFSEQEQKTVAAGTTITVASGDIAEWASADIDIGADATLCFEEPKANVEFTGRITGSGHFVARSAVTMEKTCEFKMNGDATGFTGGFFYTNVIARIVTPTSVGDSAKIVIYVVYDNGNGAKSHFFGPSAGKPDYIYRNPLDVRVGANNGLVVNDRTVLVGDIIHRAGVIHGPGKITGNITTFATTITLADNLHVEGSCFAMVTDAIIANNNSMYLKGATDGFSLFKVINCYEPVYLEGDNLFGDNVVLQMGENFSGDGKHSGRLELNGHSQVFKRVYFKKFAPEDENDIALKYVGGIGNTGSPATVTFANNDAENWFYGCLDGHLSVTVSGSKFLGFVGPTNTMDGTITSTGGGGNVTLGYSWPKVKNIVSRDGGCVVFAASAIINPKVTIDIDDKTSGEKSKIRVATGLNMKVRALRINGVNLPIGTYHRYSTAVDGHFDTIGTGTIEVLGDPGFILSVR